MSRALSLTAIGVSSVALLMCGWTLVQQQRMDSPHRVLHARGLVIADHHGQPRVVLGAHAAKTTRPQMPSPDQALSSSGLTLLGPDGAERGHYATFDAGGEAVLRLDDASGATEVFKVVANPDRGATLTVKHQNNTGAMLTSWQGSPELLFVEDGGRAFFVRPGAAAAP